MKRWITALITLLLAGTGLDGTASAEPARGLNWRPCPENTAVQCATLTVPVDWARPTKGTIDVEVARRPATGDRTGTLVFLPGGPGDSGVDNVLRGETVPTEVAARFDVVSFDPRGTNRSTPVRCDATVLANQPNVIPDSGATLVEVTAYSKRLGDNCREHTTPATLLDHLDSVSVAHDMDALRAALGERKLSLYGRSYGTLAGQMYAEHFPRRVRAMVLDSVFDHSLDPRRFLDSEARTVEDSFTEFATWCAADTACALHGRDVRQVYRDLYERSLRGELPVPTIELLRRTFRFFYGPDWPGAADWLRSLPGPASAASETTTFTMGSFCADNQVDIASQREWRRQNQFAPTMRAHFGWLGMSLCAGWPAPTANPQHRTDIDDAVPPILIMQSRHDPATPYEWAPNVARQLDRSVLLTYDGWGHGVLDRTECTRAAFTRYLVEGTTPWPGTHCPIE